MGSFDLSCSLSGAPVRLYDEVYWGFFRALDLDAGSILTTPLFGGRYEDYGCFSDLEGYLSPQDRGITDEELDNWTQAFLRGEGSLKLVVFLKPIFDSMVKPFPACLTQELVDQLNGLIVEKHEAAKLTREALSSLGISLPDQDLKANFNSLLDFAIAQWVAQHANEDLESAFIYEQRRASYRLPTMTREAYTLLDVQDIWRRRYFEDLRRYVSLQPPRCTQQDPEEYRAFYRKRHAVMTSMGLV